MPLVGVALPYMPFGRKLGFTHLPFEYYPILVGFVVCYLALVEIGKSYFYRRQITGARSRGAARTRFAACIVGPPASTSRTVRRSRVTSGATTASTTRSQ